MQLKSIRSLRGRTKRTARICTATLAAAVVGLGAHGGAQAAPFTSYSDLTAWTAAVSGTVAVEDFADATLLAGVSTANGLIGGGVFTGDANTQFNDANNPRWNFTSSKAFGANFDLAPGGAGDGLLLVLGFADGSTGTYNVLNAGTGAFAGFLGFVSTVDIRSVRFDSFVTGFEQFSADNLRFLTTGGGGGGGGTVPEPGTLALCGLAAATMALRRRPAKRDDRQDSTPTPA